MFLLIIIFLNWIFNAFLLSVYSDYVVSFIQKFLGDRLSDPLCCPGYKYFHCLTSFPIKSRYSLPILCSRHFFVILYPIGENTISIISSATAPVSAQVMH